MHNTVMMLTVINKLPSANTEKLVATELFPTRVLPSVAQSFKRVNWKKKGLSSVGTDMFKG